MLSFAYGADEFIYVLGACLINYVSVIGAGMYQSATVGSQKQMVESREITHHRDKNAVHSMQPTELPRTSNSELPSNTDNATAAVAQQPPVEQPRQSSHAATQHVSPKRTKLDWTKWTTGPQILEQSENELQESQLRDQIRNLKVVFEEDDDSILAMADVAGLSQSKPR